MGNRHDIDTAQSTNLSCYEDFDVRTGLYSMDK